MDSWKQLERLYKSLDGLDLGAAHARFVEQMRRLGDLARPYEHIGKLTKDITRASELVGGMGSLSTIGSQLELITRNSPRFADLTAFRAAIEAAARPFPDWSALVAPETRERIARHHASVDAAIRDAQLIADVEWAGDGLGESDQPIDAEPDVASSIEPQLVLASPETLEQLRRVEFAPFTLLDQVLRDPEAMRRLDAREFEEFVAMLVEKLGFEQVLLTPRSGDEGRDVVATKRVHGVSILCAFECKRYAANRPVGPDIARALLGVITHPTTRANKGVLVTTSTFTPAARRFIVAEPSLDGRDFAGVVEWLDEYRQSSEVT